MKTFPRYLLFGALMLAGTFSIAVETPRAQQPYTSLPASVATTINGKQITIEYYAPVARGRKIMGALVPFGEVWCTGANWATKITSDAALEMGTLKLPAGSYSIWTIPDKDEWTLIINKQTGQFHLDYDKTRDFGRTKMNVKKLDTPVETFRIELRNGEGNQGTLALLWENTEASIPFRIIPKDQKTVASASR
jgi:hypothetical protein